jgi:hypothetical protein
MRRNGPGRLPRRHKVRLYEYRTAGRGNLVPTARRVHDTLYGPAELPFFVRRSPRDENAVVGFVVILPELFDYFIIINCLPYFKRFKYS